MKKIPTTIPGAMLLAAGLLFGNASYASVCVDSDYGDAPDNGMTTGTGSYNTLASRNGPWHHTCADVYLGTNPGDPDNGTLQDGTATKDDTTSTIPGYDDEDGVPLLQLPTIYTVSTSTTMQVTATNNTSGPARVACWIDFNRNGQFGDLANELATTTVAAASGTQTYTLTFSGFDAPATAGMTYLRCRITTAWTLASDATPVGPTAGGTPIDGEVEDYAVPIIVPPLCVPTTLTPLPAAGGKFKGLQFTVDAALSSLANVASITCQKTINIDVPGMVFAPTPTTGPVGSPPTWTYSPTTNSVTVQARKASSASATIACTAADSAGKMCATDPVIEDVVRVKGQAVTLKANNGQPFTSNFRFVKVVNGSPTTTQSPGLTDLEINVNGTKFKLAGLKDGESYDVPNFAQAMDRDANYISLTGKGKPGATASVFISDTPLQ